MIKLALVDDHVVVRKSLAVLISMIDDFEIVFEAADGGQCIEQLSLQTLPDIILLDITMPVMNGIQTSAWLQQHHPEIKILALSMLTNDLTVQQMLNMGAAGYLSKDCEPAELKKALHEIYENGYYYNQLVTPAARNRQDIMLKITLNDRELAFLKWACTELTHKQIAIEMQVSPRTVDGYRDALFRKLNVNSRIGIALYAIKNGYVQL